MSIPQQHTYSVLASQVTCPAWPLWSITSSFPIYILLQQASTLHPRCIWATWCQTLLSNLMVHFLRWLELVSSLFTSSPWHPPASAALTQLLIRLHCETNHKRKPGFRTPRKKSRETARLAWVKEHLRGKRTSERKPPLRSHAQAAGSHRSQAIRFP